jgi:hypothetical protein
MKWRPAVILCLVTVLVVVGPLSRTWAGEKEDEERAEVLEEVKTLLADGDTYSAMEFVSSTGKPRDIAERYFNLVIDFYWKEHSLPDLITMARAGIQYCLTKAQELPEDRSEEINKLRSTAKAISYNLASFCWPGWEQPGIDIAPRDLAIGLDAAMLNLRLARELKKPAAAVSAAYWVLGAQYMAMAEYDEAMDAFVMARGKAREAEDEASMLMNSGYIAIVMILEGTEIERGEKQFDEAVADLAKMDTDDANFYAGQLKSVRAFFAAGTVGDPE